MAEVEIIKIEIDKANAAQKLVQVKKVLADSLKVRSELNKKIAEGATLTKKETLELALAERQVKKNRIEQRQLINQISAENNSLQQLRNELVKLKKQRNEQSTSTEEGRKAFQKITQQIDEYNDSIKEAEQAGGDFQRSVGNYKTALEGSGKATKTAGAGVQGFGMAIKAIPLLFIIELVKKFVDILLQNAEVAELVEDALAGLNNVFGVLIDNVVAIGKLFGEVVSGQKSFSDAISEGTDRITGLGKSLQEAAKEGFNASKALRQIEEDSARLAIATNKTQRAIEGQLTVLADQNASLEQRKKAGQEASALITEQINKEIDLEKRRLKETLKANKASENKVQDTIKELQIQAKIEELEAQKVARQKEVLGQVSGIEKQVRTEQLKTINDRQKAELELENFRNEIIANETEKAQERAEALIQIERNRLEIALSDETLFSSQRILLEEQTAQAIREIRENESQARKEELKGLSEFISENRKSSLDNLIENEEEKQGILETSFLKSVDNAMKIQGLENERTARAKAEADTRSKIANLQADQEIQAVATVASTASGLLKENTIAFKVAKSIEATVSTFTAINKTLAEPSLPFPSNVITASLIGVQGALNIANINAAAGGGEFITTKPTLLMVGDNPTGTERVTVEPIGSVGITSVSANSGLVKMAGGGSIISGGGERSSIQAQATSEGFDMSAFSEAMQSMNLVVGVKEIAKKQNRVRAKENIGKIG